ncbi:sensor domain-containing diguanylate cyclase [Litchfieldia salsa]|uniref:Diguanylate cyclase (GGDEF) domain-containing protein n=1 Tax=Litchfieldia salsa TaxID=930152 RepID=A0A1H0W4Y2_9BACI|nr:sensor domain-containing diguanylate cyclase [Litchfieldia salsa]SDP85770.1 diguanylate cyclase (GGDEF) domain-containing protein [Litchfieldia salsa]
MNFKVANDLLDLASSLIEGKFFYIGKFENNTFTFMKVLDNGMVVNVNDGDTINISESYCQQIFRDREPVIISNTDTHACTKKLDLTKIYNIQSYVGVPIFYQDGELYGTICAIDNEKSKFDQKEADVLSRFANLYTNVVELERKAKIDELTSLYNRRFLYESFDSICKHGALVLFDLDGFKEVNDHFGHEVGDSVLKEVGKRMKDFLGNNGLAVRLGGDEFVIVLPDVTENSEIEIKASSLLKILSDWEDYDYNIRITVSIGISLFPRDGLEVSTLLKNADIAMYHAKKSGKNTFQFFNTI